jgi:glycosyltransferase involved in cell wall biosynthesis
MRKRPKLIVEIHNDWKEGIMHYHPTRYARIEKAARNAVGSFSLSAADAYRAISEYSRRLLPENGRPVSVFPTYTDLESFRQPDDRAVADMRQRYGEGYFFYAGMLIHLKGVHHLIDAFVLLAQDCPQARLVIAGKGLDEHTLKARAARACREGRIIFAGHVEQRVLAACIKNSLCFVLPSLTEGLGRVALEAHLLERPVIASRVGGVPEIVIDGETGLLVDPGDTAALRNAMKELLLNPERAMAMGRAGRERVEKTFTYERYFESYYELVRAALG